MNEPRDMVPSLTARLLAFQRGDPSQVLDEQALNEAAQAVQIARETLAERGELLVDVAYVVAWLHWFRYLVLGEQHELEAAIPHFSVLADVDHDWVPPQVLALLRRQPGELAQQAFELLGQALEDGDRQSLDLAIVLLDEELAVAPQGDPAIPGYLTNLGIALGTRFGASRLPEDIDRAVAVFEHALLVTPEGHPDRSDCFLNLGMAVVRRFRLSAGTTDLDTAIACLRRAASTMADGRRHLCLTHLGAALLDRFEGNAEVSDIDAAITHLRQAVASAPDHLAAAEVHTRLSNALRIRFAHAGRPDDLDAAVEEGNEALRLTPEGHPLRGAALSNLGAALRARFQRSGALIDGDAAIERLRQAEAVVADADNLAICLSNLAGALSTRYERTKSLDDIDDAISTAERVIQVAPDGFPTLYATLNTLCGALLKRHARTRLASDIDAAIDVGRRAVEAVPADHHLRGDHLCNLGSALARRFADSSVPDDIDSGIDHLRQAVEVTRKGHPHSAEYLHNLGAATLARFEHIGDPSDLDAAIAAYGQAAAVDAATTTTRLFAARMAAVVSAARHGPHSGLSRFQAALELLPLLNLRGLKIDDQQHVLHEAVGSLGLDAAACANAAARPAQAVELLEQGRNVLWSHVLDTRSDLGRLGEHSPELAAALSACRDVLDTPEVR